MFSPIAVRAMHEEDKEAAQHFASRYALAFEPGEQRDFELHFQNQETLLLDCRHKKPIVMRVDFVGGANLHRFRFGGGKSQAIAKAVGVTAHNKPGVLDATAGLGKDAFVLAGLGCEVSMIERNPLALCLLQNGLQRATEWLQSEQAQEDPELKDALATTIARMHLVESESLTYLKTLESGQFNVVYLDPMFPEKKKSAQVKKDMQAFQCLIGKDEDADELLEPALNAALNRVIVKRPAHAPYLAGREPGYQIKGKSSRFDVYAIKKF